MTEKTPTQGEDPQVYAQELPDVGDRARRAVFNETWLIIAVVCVGVGLIGRYEIASRLGDPRP